ncbi:MAG: tetratricopeptide repeat protein [Muribaculaceae bacterium]|nr:tetratricopeptide repeat protein [Muribaculaceae bacterium]
MAVCLAQSFELRAADSSAEQAYRDGDYQSAIQQLEAQRAEGSTSSALYYDLANAYFKSGNNGAAVLNYNKALRLSPTNSQARNNLDYVEAQVQLANESLTDGKNIDPTPADPGIIDNLCDTIARWSSNTWAVIAVILFLATLSCVVIYLFCAKVVLRKVGFFGGFILLALCIISIYCSVLSKRSMLSKETCVLMSTEALLHEEATSKSKTIATPLSAGTTFQIMETIKAEDGTPWTHVFLNTDYNGWLPSSEVAVVELPELRE